MIELLGYIFKYIYMKLDKQTNKHLREIEIESVLPQGNYVRHT